MRAPSTVVVARLPGPPEAARSAVRTRAYTAGPVPYFLCHRAVRSDHRIPWRLRVAPSRLRGLKGTRGDGNWSERRRVCILLGCEHVWPVAWCVVRMRVTHGESAGRRDTARWRVPGVGRGAAWCAAFRFSLQSYAAPQNNTLNGKLTYCLRRRPVVCLKIYSQRS